MAASTRRAVFAVAGGALLVAALTALVFLIRAGGDPANAATWPITWELRSSDNGPLFQFLQDVVTGRPLDWSFSPQVFVFPELPISAIAFFVTGGSIYGYYLVVAMLNDAILFLVLVGLARVLFPEGRAVLRAAIATTPLLVLPLVGTSWILSFHLAPTYYFGMYAALLAAPLLVLSSSRAVQIALGMALALTAASNPLALVFAAPATAIALLLFAIRSGWKSARRPVIVVAATLLVALLLRLLFSPLQGTSPFTYVNAEVFARRLAQIGPYFAFQARDPAAAVVLTTGLVLAVLCLAVAAAAAALYLQGRRPADARLIAVVYLGVVPLGGLGGTFVLMITHYLYFWPVLILPFVLVLLAVPRVALPAAAASGAVVFVVAAIATGLTTNLGTADRYFGYRTAETACLDAAVPGQLGYATFSDARRVSLTSATGVRLIQIESSLEPSHWLTNRAYSRTEAGTFFYVNGHGDELPIDALALSSRFGNPDREVACDDGQSVLIYSDSAKLARIAAFYGVPRR
ncbi:MAG: hypothetical protein JWP32_2372 [Schumannella sp.]|nr:hypothetical protein [Schumannella sp.]